MEHDMPCPFPGVDPFIEDQTWSTFHAAFLADALGALNRDLRPKYVVRVDERVYVERPQADEDDLISPDLTVIAGRAESLSRSGTAAVADPLIVALPVPEEVKERYLTVRERETMEVVTVVELLSPSNKRRGSIGREEYLEKRESVLLSPVHLVEIDLLLGGERMPVVGKLPAADYLAVVSRAHHRRRSELYRWALRDMLPSIPLPLLPDDADAALNLQAVFTTAYERAGFDYSLDYSRPLGKKLPADDLQWIAHVVREGLPA
jgi:hypothetical protein